MIKVPNHETSDFTLHFRLTHSNIRPEYFTEVLTLFLSVLQTVEVILTETLLLVNPVIVHLVRLGGHHLVLRLHTLRHPLHTWVCVADTVHHLHAVALLHHAWLHTLHAHWHTLHTLAHALRHTLRHPLWHALRHPLHALWHPLHPLGHALHWHTLHGHALHLHALRHVGHAPLHLHVHHLLPLLHAHVAHALLLHAVEPLAAHLLLHAVLPPLVRVSFDCGVELVLPLFLTHEVCDVEWFPHEHFAVHVLQRLECIFGFLVADLTKPAVNLVLLVTLLYILYLDFD